MTYSSSSHSNSVEPPPTNQVDEALITAAIIGVIQSARGKGQSLEELTAEVLADDNLLDQDVRQVLSDIVIEAWKYIPEPKTKSETA